MFIGGFTGSVHFCLSNYVRFLLRAFSEGVPDEGTETTGRRMGFQDMLTG